MLQLDVLRLLEENGKTKYWLYKQLGMSYQNFSRMVNNQTKSIRYENIETMCLLLILTFNKNKIFIEGAPLTRCTFQRINRRKGVPYSIRRTYGAIKSSLGKVYFLSNASMNCTPNDLFRFTEEQKGSIINVGVRQRAWPHF